ncbi:NADH-quinone oxidoreductase subunit A [Rubritalea marina]|uniref:NADH-quinone oxidoreductase subunit A n=1 Tax=Rubritalea marina TaxID=361055 RepID=UPI00036BAA59|nr:NADH-quinone oxidoreductase subunit A [Rubritalea marina]
MLESYLPVVLQAVIAIGFAAIALGLSVLLGKKGSGMEAKDTVYECGMLPIGGGTPRFSVKFYLVAMLFVLFDIEVVFMYPFAVQFHDLIRESSTALYSVLGFAGILAVAYVYALKKGAFSWNE